MSAPAIRTFTNTYSQDFHNESIHIGPDEHSRSRLAEYQQACINAALLDPSVGSVQYGAVVKNGAGNQWAIVFINEKHDLVVHKDRQTKGLTFQGPIHRSIYYTLNVTVVQEWSPMSGNDGSREPKQISVIHVG